MVSSSMIVLSSDPGLSSQPQCRACDRVCCRPLLRECRRGEDEREELDRVGEVDGDE